MPPLPSHFAGSVVLTGPTGSGKSAVALTLAERLNGEIVSMDSMTLYRGMDIGTAKPSLSELARVPHHLIDVLDPHEVGNIAWWLERAAIAVTEIRNRDRLPIFVGGTPFFLRALLMGLFEAPPVDPAIREKWTAEAERVGPIELHQRLEAIDPVAAKRIHANDVRRVIRALEVFEATGKPISAFQQSWDTPNFEGQGSAVSIPVVAIDWPREVLYERINNRVESMFAAGWVDEVRRLQALNPPMSREANMALGYREIATHLRGEATMETTIAEIQMRTRQFAKRQLTWFRNWPGLEFVPCDASDLEERIVRIWEKMS